MSTQPDGRDDDAPSAAIADGTAEAAQTRGPRLRSAGGAAADGGGNEPSPPRRSSQILSTQRGEGGPGAGAVSDNDLEQAPPALRGKTKKRGASTVGRPRKGPRQPATQRHGLFSQSSRDRARLASPHRDRIGGARRRLSSSPGDQRPSDRGVAGDTGDDDASLDLLITGAALEGNPTRSGTAASGPPARGGRPASDSRGAAAPSLISERELQKLIAAGGAGAPNAGGATRPDPVTSLALSAITEQAVFSLLGSVRGRLLKLDATAARSELRDMKQTNAIYDQLRKQGTAIPESICNTLNFFTFQNDPWRLLKQAPFSMRRLREWAHGAARWQIPALDDDSQKGEFTHLVAEFGKIAVQLTAALATTTRVPGSVLRPTLREKTDLLIVRFCDWRHRHLSAMVARALGDARLTGFHEHYRALDGAYADEAAWIQLFLIDLGKQFSMAVASKDNPDEQEDHIARAWLGVYMAFIVGLRNGDLPAVDPAEAAPAAGLGGGGASGAVSHAAGWAVTTAPPAPPAYYQPSLPGAAPTNASYAPLAPAYPSPYPTDGALSLDQIARQVWAGLRAPGNFFGGGGGAAIGIDLPDDSSRRLLFAHQIRNGLRAAGDLFLFPPRPCAALPSLPDMGAPPLPPPAQPYTSGRAGSTLQTPLPPPPPYTPATGSAGPSPRDARAGGTTRIQARPSTQSDELFIPYSSAMLGSHTPFREIRAPAVCFECNMPHAHFGNECPQRFLRVRGETPPGWIHEHGTSARNAAAWSGAELTTEARAEYRAFLARHPVPAHHMFPVSIDDITSAQPPPVRRAVGGRRQ